MTAETIEAGSLDAPSLSVAADLVVGAAAARGLVANTVAASLRLEAGALRTAGALDAASLSGATTISIEGAAAADQLAGEALKVAGALSAARAAAGGVYGPDAAIAGLLTVGSCAGCEGE